MKKILLLFLTVVLCFVTVGCEKTPIYDSSAADISFVVSEEQSQQEPLKLPDSVVKTDVPGLYSFINEIKDVTVMVNASVSGDVIRFEFMTPGLNMTSIKIVLYSLSEDKITGEVSLPESAWSIGELDSGGFYTVSLTDDEISFYDKNGKETYHKEAAKSNMFWSYATISPDGKYMLYNRAIDGRLVMYEISTGIETEINNEPGTYIPFSYKDGFFFVRSYESGIFKVSTQKREIESIYNKGNPNLITSSYAIGDFNSYFSIVPLEDPENAKMTALHEERENPVAASENFFATTVSDGGANTLRFYNIKDSTVSPAISIDGYIQKILFIGEDFALIVSSDIDFESISYYLYDLSETTSYNDIAISKADESVLMEEIIPEWKGDARLISLAEEMLEKYNVRVFFNYGDIDTEAFNYSSEKADEEVIYEKMQTLNEFLDYFPDGMMDEIGLGHGTWIYLCGALRDTETDRNISALATKQFKHPLIIADVTFSNEVFKETMVHEISHLIDSCIDFKWLNGWFNLLPEDISGKAYFNSYYNTTDNAYTPYNNGANEVWFYDNYSRTFPTEDRAQIFSKMYFSYTEGELTEEFKKHENLKEKARFYSVMLRDAFVSCKNAENLPWETLFGDIDENEFSWVME